MSETFETVGKWFLPDTPDRQVAGTLSSGVERIELALADSLYRLGALAKLIQAGEGGKWTLPGLNPEYHLVNECVFRAAARAPLFEARTVGDVSFDPPAFMKIAFEESEAEGSA
jgi:hypothetical protein